MDYESGAQPHADDSDKYVDWYELHCKVCDVTVTSEDNLEKHLEGAKHRKKLVLLEKGVIQLSEKVHEKFDFIPGELPAVPMLQSQLDECTNPLIGLEYITENHCHGYEPRYQCLMCDTKMDLRVCIMHICGAGHREYYMEKHYPNYYNKVVEVQDTMKTAEKNALLTLFAREIESKDGRRRIQLGTNPDAFEGVPRRKVKVTDLPPPSAQPRHGSRPAGRPKTLNESMRDLLFHLDSSILCTEDEARMAAQITNQLVHGLKRYQARTGILPGVVLEPSDSVQGFLDHVAQEGHSNRTNARREQFEPTHPSVRDRYGDVGPPEYGYDDGRGPRPGGRFIDHTTGNHPPGRQPGGFGPQMPMRPGAPNRMHPYPPGRGIRPRMSGPPEPVPPPMPANYGPGGGYPPPHYY